MSTASCATIGINSVCNCGSRLCGGMLVSVQFNMLFTDLYVRALLQIAVLVSRALLKMWRNPMTSVAQVIYSTTSERSQLCMLYITFLQLIVMVVFSLIVGGIYYQLDNSQLGIQNRYV